MPLQPNDALDLLASVLGELQLAGLAVVAHDDGADVTLTVRGVALAMVGGLQSLVVRQAVKPAADDQPAQPAQATGA